MIDPLHLKCGCPKPQLYYVLDDDGDPRAASYEEFIEACDARCEAIDNGERDPWRIARTPIGEIVVSTVFIGLNTAPRDPDPPMFETVVFGSHGGTWRWKTREQAIAGHDRVVAALSDSAT